MSTKHCRICYKLDQDDLISVRLKQDGISIEEMVLTITGISVSGDRRLPQNICLQCLDRLKDAFELRQQCVRTHDRLCAELASTCDVIVQDNEPIKPDPDDVTSDDDASIIIEKIEIDPYDEGASNPDPEQSDRTDEERYEAIELLELACCGCAARFSTRDELEEHATLQHRNGRLKPQFGVIHCRTCFQSFPDQVMLDRHLEELNYNHHETMSVEADEFTDEEEEEEEDEAIESDRSEDGEEQTTEPKTKRRLQKAIIQGALCCIAEKNLLTVSNEQQGYMIVELQPYRCCCCAELFQTEQELNTHLEEKGRSNDTGGTSDPEMKYTCEYCGKRFAYWLVYVCHKRVRDQRQFYMCGLCDALLDSKTRMISHMVMSDEHADYFKLGRASVADRYEAKALSGMRCCCCKKYFDSESERIEHMARVHDVPMGVVANLPKRCKLCYRHFRTERHLELHLQYTQDVTQYYCKLCEFQTYNPRRMELHLYSGIHRDKLPTSTVQLKPLQNNLLTTSGLQYCCFEHCHKPFPDSPALKQHIHEAHEPALTANRSQTEKLSQLLLSGTYHACNDCGILFKNLTALQAHRARRPPRQPLMCAVCGVSKSSRSLLRIHERSHTGERPYRCNDCDKTFVSSQGLLSHRRCHVTGTHRCDTCGGVFNRKENLNRHVLLKHGVATIPCDDCPKLFKTIHMLNRHKLTHTGEKRYKCRTESCNKRYVNEVDRRRHEMSVHTLERPHKCAQCGAGFIRKRQLTVHERRHTGVKPFVCTVCGKDFVDVGPLRNHMRNVCQRRTLGGKEVIDSDA